MMDKFAKIFDTERGQVVAMIKSNDDDGRPELRFFVKPSNGLDVCSLAFSYADSDSGWNKAEKAFEECDEALALKAMRVVEGAVEESL